LGDIETAMTAEFNYCRQSLFAGKDLASVEKECSTVTKKMAQNKQIQSCLAHSSHHLIILMLSGDARSKSPFDAFSGAFDCEINSEEDLLQHALSTGKAGVVQAIRFNRLFLAYWFKRYDEAAEMASLYKTRMMMPLIDAYHAFFEGLTAFHFARQAAHEPKWIDIGNKVLDSYRTYASHSKWNWENKLLLLEAENHYSKGELDEAEQKYSAAIKSAHEHRFIHEEGLAQELFSAFHVTHGNLDKAKHHILQARACYEKWGAFALVDMLDSSDLLVSAMQ